MLGPVYGEWWRERPAGRRLRGTLLLVPVLLLAAFALLSRPAPATRVPELFDAAARGDTTRLAALLRDGVPVRAGDADGTPLLRAVQHGHAESARLLIEHGADANTRDRHGLSALHVAAEAGDERSVAVLLAASADANASSTRNGTPLHRAALHGHAAVVASLLARGAQLDARDSRGLTPLHYAVRADQDAMAAVLIAAGADIDARGHDGRTLLHWATAGGRPDIVESLLRRGAKPAATDTHGNTPLHLAARRGDERAAALLVAAGAEVDARTPYLRTTPLHLAVRDGHQAMTRLLLAAGADADITSAVHGRPGDIAQSTGQQALARMLVGAPATTRPKAIGDGPASPCALPARIHPASLEFLDAWTDGDLDVAEFRRGFSLPDSDYLPLGECLAGLYAAH